MEPTQTFLFVEQYVPHACRSVRNQFPNGNIVLVRDLKKKKNDTRKQFSEVNEVIYVEYEKPWKITEALLPYHDSLVAVTARGEEGANYFKLIIPHVPYLRTPTTESLEWATDKYEMRKRFSAYDKSITPRFTRVQSIQKPEVARVMQKIGFPMIVKPANLQESMWVSICYHEDDLEKTLRTIFKKLRAEYKKYNRQQLPVIIAEEYMDGDMYSVDCYVDSRGTVYHCPLVKIKTGKNIGRDDFYNYLQITPTALKRETVARAEGVAEKAVHALGLRSSTAHVELMKIDDEWKVIEVGPRVGGFRDLIHSLSCDIDHSLNDILIRIPKKPIIPKKCKGFACAMKWFAAKEGEITEMKGIKKIEQLESFHSIAVNKKIGDRAVFARNGGRSVFNLFMYNADRSKLLADIRRVEQLVEVKVSRRQKVVASMKELELIDQSDSSQELRKTKAADRISDTTAAVKRGAKN